MKLADGYRLFVEKLKSLWHEKSLQDQSSAHTHKHLDELLKKSTQYMESLEKFSEKEVQIIQEAIKHDMQEWQIIKENYPTSPAYLIIKDSLWNWLIEASDRNQIEWDAFQEDLKHQGIYYAGEMVHVMCLVCEKCQHIEEITHPQTLKPCSICQHTTFYKRKK